MIHIDESIVEDSIQNHKPLKFKQLKSSISKAPTPNLKSDTMPEKTQSVEKQQLLKEEVGLTRRAEITRILEQFSEISENISSQTRISLIDALENYTSTQADNVEYQNKTNNKVQTAVSPRKSSLLDCPIKVAPKLYEDREFDSETGKQINVLQFVEKYYGKFLKRFNPKLEHDLLYQDQLGKLDKKILIALQSYFHNNKSLREKATDYVKPKKERIKLEVQNVDKREIRRTMENLRRYELVS